MLEKLVELYWKSDGMSKYEDTELHLFKKTSFSQNQEVATYVFPRPINLLINANKVLKIVDIKKEAENDLFSCLATQT
jgi:hypothetical protein